MAPGILNDSEPLEASSNGKTEHRQPLKLSGALDDFKYEEVTPTIGREYAGVNIVDDILGDEDRLRDLAITSNTWNDHCAPEPLLIIR